MEEVIRKNILKEPESINAEIDLLANYKKFFSKS